MTNITIKTEEDQHIQIYYLKKIWNYYHQLKQPSGEIQKVEWKYIRGVFNALGIGIEPTIKYLMNENNSFEDFENWITRNGRVSEAFIQQFNNIIDKEHSGNFQLEEEVLSSEDLEQWANKGYVIIRGAVPKTDCEQAVQLIYDVLDASPDDADSWYKSHPLKQGIMVQLFNSPVLDSNRMAKKIRVAYEQLWKRNDLLVSMDRVSFNPPQTAHYQFPGPDLHWDVSLKRPIPFGLQGLLYLVDTKSDQGAFTVIPGFHNKIHNWLEELGENSNPRDINLLNSFEREPIAAQAGDFIIWHHCLPHGSSPNTSDKPRIVQYINYQPLNITQEEKEWV